MKLLIIGGTRFVGRHIARTALNSGAQVTLFHRGKTRAPELDACEHVYGDRAGDLHRLGDRRWDAVIDACAYTPSEAETSARFFAQRAGLFVFISTVSVYDFARAPALDEDSKLAVLPPGADRTSMTPATYGALKVLCEQIVQSTFNDRALILRPGLVAGPYDPTERFTYWPLRVANGGEVLMPHGADHPVQYIDARDLAAFAVLTAARGTGGVFNVVTAPEAVTFGSLFAACERAAGVSARAIYADEARLLENGVQPWADLPLWIPSTSESFSMVSVLNARAQAAGLRTRPVTGTARDVLQWARAGNVQLESLSAGLAERRERELLAAIA